MKSFIHADRYKNLNQVDEYETMELEFHSFCKNMMSREKFEEHFMHMIEREMEPNVDLVSYFNAVFEGTDSF